MKYIVYGLRDPRSMEIRYVGQSRRGMTRPREHGQPRRLKTQEHTGIGRWIQFLQRQGLRYGIVILEAFDHLITEDDRMKALDDAETRWIAVGRQALGRRFLNATAGGNGAVGRRQTDETKGKLRQFSNSERGRQCKAERIEASRTPEARARRSEAKKAFWARLSKDERSMIVRNANSPEARQRKSATHIKLNSRPERRAVIKEMLKRTHTPEAELKRSMARKAFNQTSEGLAITLAALVKARQRQAEKRSGR